MKLTNEERILFIKMFSDASEEVQVPQKKSTLDILTEKELNLIVDCLRIAKVTSQDSDKVNELEEICSVIRIHQYAQKL